MSNYQPTFARFCRLGCYRLRQRFQISFQGRIANVFEEVRVEIKVESSMINGKRIAVVLPAYNAEKTLEATVRELPDMVDIRILVDDHSSDRTVEIARRLGLPFFVHNRNYGYGRNQQTCYREALAAGADVVIMVHPDYQYTPLLVTAMASMVAYDVYDVVLGSRIIGGGALRGGM